MKGRTHALIAATLLVIGLTISSSIAFTGSDWNLDSDSFSSGGSMAGGDWSLAGTIGQSLAGNAAGGDWTVSGGFESNIDVTPVCPGDVDDSGHVDVSDLLLVLGSWGPCPGCDADLDGNGTVNVSDLLAVLGAWGECDAP